MIAFDTDVLSEFALNKPEIVERVRQLPSAEIYLPIVVVEEMMRGRLDYIRRVQSRSNLSLPSAYLWLERSMALVKPFGILPYSEAAHATYLSLAPLKLKTGTQDLRIASIALAHNAKLVSRNRRDYELVPNLNLEIWS